MTDIKNQDVLASDFEYEAIPYQFQMFEVKFSQIKWNDFTFKTTTTSRSDATKAK